MNLGHITSFLAVASSGSLTAAAQTLFLTQPAISQHIKALEEHLNVRLFVRHKSGMQLTPEGEELRTVCQAVVHAAEDISFQVQRLNHLKRGKIKIQLTSFLCSALTPALVGFKGEYPGVQLSLNFDNTEGVIRSIRTHKADIGFACTMPTVLPSGVQSLTVHCEKLILVADAGHPLVAKAAVTPADIGEHLFVTREVGTFTRQHAEAWFSEQFRPKNIIETSRVASVRELVLAGALSILPATSVRSDLADGKMVALPAEGLRSDVDCALYLSSARPLSRAARVFLQLAVRRGCLNRGDQLEEWLAGF